MLELSLVTTKAPDPVPVSDWNFVGGNFALTLPAPSKFVVQADSSIVAVSQVGFKRRPLYAPLKRRDLRVGSYVYLVLATPLAEGQMVTVTNPGGELWSDATVRYATAFDPMRRSPVLHVSQVGYLPQHSKKGMAGFYLGSLGEMAVPPGPFHIIDAATRSVVYTAQLKSRLDVGYSCTPLPYQKVYEADFTALQTPGEYVLEVPGLGASFPFLINEGTAAAFARAYAMGLYHQRCGTDNGLPYTRHDHGACHTTAAQIPDMTFSSVNYQLASMSSDYASNPLHTAPQLKDVNSSLYPFINRGVVDVSGGHHDAGDYSKYTINSASLIHHLVFAADSFPGAAALDNLNIPESGDGKTDLLQEAKREADFLSKMQDADGGFYFLVYPRDRAYEDNVLPDQGDPQVVFPKTTSVTAAAVGALAEIASSPTFKNQFPQEAANYLVRATRGWEFLTNAITQHGKNGAYQKITHYGDEFMHNDELAWAAAGMFAATGDPQYQAQLKAWYDPSDPNTRRWTWWRLFEGFGCAARTFAFSVSSGRNINPAVIDTAYLDKCRAEIIAAGDDIARFAAQTAYGASFPDPNKSFQNAGWFFSSERAFEMATATLLNTERKSAYLEAILSNLNYEGGCNPINISYITGLGWQRWREIVHQYAQNDFRALPPSGLPLGNMQSGFAYLDLYKGELGQLCYPADGAQTAPYPFYDRWGDSFNTTTEFVVVDQGRALGTAVFLMAQTGAAASPSIKVEGQLSGIPALIPADQIITANFAASGLNMAEAQVVWEATDQEPLMGPEFKFSAKNPGSQWVEVEAQWPDGTRVFARTNFAASFSLNLPQNEFQSAALDVSSEIGALYHLDGSALDATGQSGTLALAGNARFDDVNVGWMATRTGKALRFYDIGDKATVTIPAGSLFRTNTFEIALEAMVYVNAYKGYNRSSSRLLSLQRNWNASLEWIEDAYNGPHFRGGTQFDFFGNALNSALPLKEWRHLSIRINANEYSAYIDGKLLVKVPSLELSGWSNGSADLEIGNFDGWMDEVVVHCRGPVVIPAPVPPGQLSGTSLSASENKLDWVDASDNETGFRVYRSLDNQVFSECASTAANLTTWSDTGLQPGTQYYYGVSAFNGSGESLRVTTAVKTLPLPPNIPSGVTAIGQSNNIAVAWQAAAGADTYTVKRAVAAAGPFSAWATGLTSLNYTDSDVATGTTYYYIVTAVNAGGESANSSVVSAVRLSLPAPPTNLMAKSVFSTQITVGWIDVASNENGFYVERSNNGKSFSRVATLGSNATSYQDKTVRRASYYYRVSAYNSMGASAYSNTLLVRIP